MRVDKDSGLVLYRSGGYDDGKWDKWIVGTYGDTDDCVSGCLDFSTHEHQEFDTLDEALVVFHRIAEAIK